MTTQEYIKAHIARVRSHLDIFIQLLYKRAINHDSSKLSPDELPLWEQMDLEPRYPYGTPEYKDKIERYKKVFDKHYGSNRHHPEHYPNGIADMTLVDIVEMLCDWIGYKNNVSYKEATKIVADQMLRYKIITEDEYNRTIDNNFAVEKDDPNILKVILMNTLNRYYAVLCHFDGEPDGVTEELKSHETCKFHDLDNHIIDFYC